MKNKIIKFKIVTPEQIVLEEEITQVSVPTKEGEITVLPDHIPLVASLKPGVIEITTADNKNNIIAISGGFIEVLKNKVVILADTAERAEDINIDRVQAAKKQAKITKQDTRHFDQERFANISAKISKELARSSAVQRWKKIKNIK